MCGIAGYFLKPDAQPLAGCLEQMQACLHHRGPDGQESARAGRAGFTQTRLAIIDPAGGRQPLLPNALEGPPCWSPMARFTIIRPCALSWRAGLPSRAGQTVSGAAAAVAGPQARAWSTAPRGMFAAALYDEARDEGSLVRDMFGIKPLYYCVHDTGCISPQR